MKYVFTTFFNIMYLLFLFTQSHNIWLKHCFKLSSIVYFYSHNHKICGKNIFKNIMHLLFLFTQLCAYGVHMWLKTFKKKYLCMLYLICLYVHTTRIVLCLCTGMYVPDDKGEDPTRSVHFHC
jgi:hypothetical protein